MLCLLFCTWLDSFSCGNHARFAVWCSLLPCSSYATTVSETAYCGTVQKTSAAVLTATSDKHKIQFVVRWWIERRKPEDRLSSLVNDILFLPVNKATIAAWKDCAFSPCHIHVESSTVARLIVGEQLTNGITNLWSWHIWTAWFHNLKKTPR